MELRLERLILDRKSGMWLMGRPIDGEVVSARDRRESFIVGVLVDSSVPLSFALQFSR